MAKNSDNRILDLKKQVADKKAALENVKKFVPATNCNLQLDNGDRINLYINDSAALTTALVKLNALRLSAEDLGILDFEFSGFKVQDWVNDISSRLLIINKQKEETKLKAQEALLTSLLSADKKTELLLDEIMGQI